MEDWQDVYKKFVNEFAINLENAIHKKEFSNLVFLCIGTDRITGDSFGPLVGHKLKELYKEDECVHVIGDLARPIVADNINEIMQEVATEYNDSFIIAIDSAISNKTNIGKIFVTEGSMNLGTGLNKRILKVGDVSVKGVVSRNLGNPKYNFILLQNTSLNLIMNMADIASKGIYNVINV